MFSFRPALIGLIIASALLGAVACNDDDAESQNNASQGAVDELSARVQRNEMLMYALTSRNAGLHDMDETLNDTGTIESSFIPGTRLAIRLLALTDWPADFQEEAAGLRATAVDLLEALEGDDAAAAAPLAAELHEGEHDFNARITNELVKDLPPEAGGPEEHDEAESTPGVDESTPAADATAESGDHEEEPEETPTP